MKKTFFQRIDSLRGEMLRWIVSEIQKRGFESLDNLLDFTSENDSESEIDPIEIAIDDWHTDNGKIPLKLNKIAVFESGYVNFWGLNDLYDDDDEIEISEYSTEDLNDIVDFLKDLFIEADAGRIKLTGEKLKKSKR